MSIVELNNENFSKETSTDLPVLVDFNADWCGPCRMLKPIIEQLADEYKGKYKVCALNVDNSPQLAERFKIESIPALIIMKKGETVEAMIGYNPAGEIRKFMDKHIG